MISLATARQLIVDHVVARSGVAVSLELAAGRVLAEDVLADGFYPAGDRSQMDGYVVCGDAVPGGFRLAGTVVAGDAPVDPVRPGEAMRIFTGALLPPGGGRVVMQEEARCDGGMVFLERFGDNRFIRAHGSEAAPGARLVAAGTRLGAVELAVLAQVGRTCPRVVPAPVVHHLATGGELVDPSEVPGPGRIRDTNSTLLRALVAGMGGLPFSTRRVPDDLPALVEAAQTTADLLLISGGASVGDYDFGANALRELGYTIHFDRVNLRPGKPLTFATRGNQAAFVLPGNPVSHFVCFHTAVRLALEQAAGYPISWPTLWLELDGPDLIEPSPRETWWPARATVSQGKLSVTPKPWSSSGHTFALAGTNALILVNSESPRDGRALTLLLEPPATLTPSPHV